MGRWINKKICAGPLLTKDCFKGRGFVSKKELPGKGEVYAVEMYIDGKLIMTRGNPNHTAKSQIKKDMEEMKAGCKKDGINFDYKIIKLHAANEVYNTEDTRVFIK